MVEALSNMLLDALEEQLTLHMITNVADVETRITELRAGKLQDDPTKETGLNLLIYAPSEEDASNLYADNVQSGLMSPTYDIGSGFYIHPYRLRLILFFRGSSGGTDRKVARTRAQIVFARARWALQQFVLPQHPDTGGLTDDFGESVIEIQVSKFWLNEGGGPGTFIWRGWINFHFLTEQLIRGYVED